MQSSKKSFDLRYIILINSPEMHNHPGIQSFQSIFLTEFERMLTFDPVSPWARAQDKAS